MQISNSARSFVPIVVAREISIDTFSIYPYMIPQQLASGGAIQASHLPRSPYSVI